MTLQQAPTLQLDPSQAEMADAGGRISDTGDYIGTITQLKYKASDTGACGYMIDFETTDGQIADGLYINTVRRDGKPSDIGARQMSALLCCLGLRTITPVLATINEDVFNESVQRYEEQQVQAYIYPEVCKRPIGLILQKELTSRVSDGQDSYRMQYVRSFQAENRRTAAEMLAAGRAKKAGQPIPPALKVDQTMQVIEDKDSRNKQAGGDYASTGQPQGLRHNGAPLTPPASGGGGTAHSFDDDIPFAPLPSYP